MRYNLIIAIVFAVIFFLFTVVILYFSKKCFDIKIDHYTYLPHIMFTFLFFIFRAPIDEYFVYHIQESKDELNLIESYRIMKGNTKKQISMSGFKLLTYYEMSTTENDEFVFYYMNNDNEIERKKVDFDFKIKEINSDDSYYEIYEVTTNDRYCSKVFGCDNFQNTKTKKIAKLLVPLGTITNDASISLE